MEAYPGKGNNGGGQRERGRPYGVMLLLAFVAALLGVMALHKLREKRIHNLLVRDRDRELFSLHLLLQVPPVSLSEMCESIRGSFFHFCVFILHTFLLLHCTREIVSTVRAGKLPFCCPSL